MKGIDSGQYSYPVISSTTLHLIVAVAAAHQLTIDITDFTNVLQLKSTVVASSERGIIDLPPYYTT